jgi:protein-disulfide isomerase
MLLSPAPRTSATFLAISVAMLMGASTLFAQAGNAAGVPEAPSAPAAPATLTFPPVDPRNFTADRPTTPEVEAFLKATWGYDPNLAWQVQSIGKTASPGVSKVNVAIGQKNNPSQVGALTFFMMPDGQHIVSGDEMVPFGARPFEATRRILEAEANGPARGSASKDLMFVEFADFQCPHCKDAQPTIQRLIQDYPNARFVFESFPLPQHSEAPKAAAYGVCVQKAGGDDAFFKYADAVFTNQANLTPEGSDQALKDIVTKLGLDPAKIAACSTSPVGVDGVKVSLDLSHKLEVRETPTLYVNGRALPIGGIQYDQLKQIISYQAAQDGVTTAAVTK